MTNLSNRVLNMEESVTLAASARAKALKAEGRDISSITLGEPDFVTLKISKMQLLRQFKMVKQAFTQLLQDYLN